MLTTSGADYILDWRGREDRLSINGYDAASIAGHYAEDTAPDFAAALAKAHAAMDGRAIFAMSISVGSDVVVFSGSPSSRAVDSATILVGRSLADIAAGDFY